MASCEGIKEHLVRKADDPSDTHWEYTYHQRLFAYTVPGIGGPMDQIETLGKTVRLGRYVHMADNDHLYGSCFREFEGRFLRELKDCSFEERTMRYEDMADLMEEARPGLLEKARTRRSSASG